MSSRIKLGSVIRIMHGYAFKSENYVAKSKYRLITLGNFAEDNNSFKYNDDKATYYGTDFPRDFILNTGDLIMPLTEQVIGLFGNSAFVPYTDKYTFVLNQRVGKVVCDESKADKYFIHYLLATDSVKKQLEARASGTRQRNISPDDVYDVEVFLPDISTQKRIGAILYNIEQKQENNNDVCADLEGVAKLLYDYWFVQFDFPDKNGKPYKSSGGKMVWNEELKREIPDGWDVSMLGKECQILLGGTPDTSNSEYWNGSIPWLNSGEVAYSPVLSAEKSITEKGMNNSATAYAKSGAVVMSITRYIRPSILGIDACFNQSVVAIIPTKKYHTSFIYPMIKTNVDRYMSLRTGAQQPHINKEIVAQTTMVCPSESVLRQYYQIVDCLYDQQMKVSKENQELASLRDFLLPMLMNGQVTVKKGETQ